MRTQFELTFLIGYAEENPHFDEDVIAAACRLCGGCFRIAGQGFWIDGETHATAFLGQVEAEHCLAIKLTCEPHKLENVYQQMAAEIARLADAWSVETDWVHVQQTEIVGRHFSVKAAQAAAAS